jgi:hypothetical protein
VRGGPTRRPGRRRLLARGAEVPRRADHVVGLHVCDVLAGRRQEPLELGRGRAAGAVPEFEFIDRARAQAALMGQRAGTEATAWALDRKACIELDGKIVPSATTGVALLRSLAPATA